MGEGARSSSPQKPGARLLSASLRAGPPGSHCPPSPRPTAAFCSPGFCPGEPAASPSGEGSRTGRERRGKGRDEARGGAEEGGGKAGCVSGEGGEGAIMSVQPRGCVFYLFIF